MMSIQSWSPSTEKLLADFNELGLKTTFCPNKIREHFQGVKTAHKIDLDEMILAEALSFALSQPNKESAFDDAINEQLPDVLSYQIQGSIHRKPGEFLWDCFDASPLKWMARYGITQSRQYQLDITLGAVTDEEISALFRRNFLSLSGITLPSSSKKVVFEHTQRINLDRKSMHAKERDLIPRKGMKSLGRSFLQRISESASRNGMVWDISQRLVAFLGIEMQNPRTGVPFVIEVLNDCLSAFEAQSNSQYAIEGFCEELIPALSRIWRTEVRCAQTGEVWPKHEKGFLSWAETRNHSSYEVYDVAAEPLSFFEERREAFTLAPAILSRRELTIFGIPLPGMQKPLDMHRDPLWPQQ